MSKNRTCHPWWLKFCSFYLLVYELISNGSIRSSSNSYYNRCPRLCNLGLSQTSFSLLRIDFVHLSILLTIISAAQTNSRGSPQPHIVSIPIKRNKKKVHIPGTLLLSPYRREHLSRAHQRGKIWLEGLCKVFPPIK